MPVEVRTATRRLSESEFAQVAYDVMGCVFDIHNEFGRFFDERIYKRELARRLPGIELEVPVEVTFDSFGKLYFIDVTAASGGVFEFKAVDVLTDRHRSQLLHYLLLADLPRGKFVNVRTEHVQHEFVNTTLRPEDRTGFQVADHGWRQLAGRETEMRDWLIAFLRDLGAGLDLSLYEDALAHFLGGEGQVLQEIDVVAADEVIGTQVFRLVGPGVALKVTTLTDHPHLFEIHSHRLLEHTTLTAIQWINITRKEVAFKTIQRA